MRRLPLRHLMQLAVLGLMLVVAGWFYVVLRTRTADASALPPFAGVIGRDLPLLREVRIVQSQPADLYERPFRLIDDPDQPVSEGEPPARVLPVGTVLRFDTAHLVRGGTSGVTLPILLGTVTLAGEAHAFEYIWGWPRYMNADGTASFGPPLRYLFPQAPWQSAADPAIYTFPEP